MYRKILNGAISVDVHIEWVRAKWDMFTEAEPFQVEITPYKRSTTSAQRKLMWGWYYKYLSDALDEAGITVPDDQGHEYPYSKDLLHEILKDMFLVKTEITRQGKTRKLHWSLMELPKSGTGTLKPSFSEYLDKVKNFSREYFNIDIPDPIDEYWRSYFNEALN